MLSKILSSAVLGIDAYIVEVEIDIASGLPVFTTVGLPETAVKESKERVKAAISNSGYVFPDDRITVNLAPANIKKEGTGFDLPIALGILSATGLIPQKNLSSYLVLGELSLDGRVKPVKGSLPVAIAGKKSGYDGIVVPFDNGREASVVSGISIIPIKRAFWNMSDARPSPMTVLVRSVLFLFLKMFRQPSFISCRMVLPLSDGFDGGFSCDV